MSIMPITKECNRCGEIKPLDEYGKNAVYPDGKHITCKACINKRSKQLRPALQLFDKVCEYCGQDFIGKKNQKYCSSNCSKKMYDDKRIVEMVCDNCGKTFIGRPADYEHRFCSKVCQGRFNTNIDVDEDYDDRRKWRNKITVDAKNVASDREQECAVCGYDKAVDVCHIIPVQSFTTGTSKHIVNDPSNLVLLCKNHHWELDHDLAEFDINDYRYDSVN